MGIFRFLSTHCTRSLGCSRRVDCRTSCVWVYFFIYLFFFLTFRVVVILRRKNNPVRDSDESFDHAETAPAFPLTGPGNSPAFPIKHYPSFLIFEISKERCLFFFYTHALGRNCLAFLKLLLHFWWPGPAVYKTLSHIVL